ncbi:MAG: DnaJ domain-containing protein [Gemmatimonadales bacterium]
MTDPGTADHYEVLQISPRADQDTIQRVFRHLAKRFHPDNTESGNAIRFRELADAFEVLSDPARRAQYDVQHAERTARAWRIFDQDSALDDVETDRRIRSSLLSILYTARRADSERPGMGEVDLERMVGCPETHMHFHVWYLKENGLVKRMDNGLIAITAAGVDAVLESGGPVRPQVWLLDAGDEPAQAAG